ncbi:MAG: electron transfer flavoprotein subunit beta/FixA family protein [Gammaproteobacteria bacterium]
MHLLVCTKFVVDSNLLQAEPASGRPDLKRAPFRINTFDENAIETALQLKASHGGRVIAVSLCASAPPKEVMLKALAMGVDALYLAKHDAGVEADACAIATILADTARGIARLENLARWDLILCGEASVDEYNGQVGPRLAEALGLPVVTYTIRLGLTGSVLRADRALEDRTETVEVELPAVVTVGMEINTPRMPTVLQIMGAGRKPIVDLAPASTSAAPAGVESGIGVLDVISPPSARKQIAIGGETVTDKTNELLRRLGADGEVKF